MVKRLEPTLRIGDRISAFRLDGLVGTGGMGSVYRATHLLDDHVVALKVLHDDQLAFDRAVDRMMREATILASVGHVGIPQLFECGLLPDGRPWIAMELVDGVPLAARVQHRTQVAAHLVMDLVGNVADVLAAAHERGVTHRDLKPDNIFLTPHDAVFPVRVIDWGIAHHAASTRYTNLNEAIGTPTYMSPEQARGGPTSGHCDVYGLGIVAYQALCGYPPFLGDTAVEILVQHLSRPVPPLEPKCPDAPRALVDLVEWMLVKRCEDRPSAVDVSAAVARMRDADPAYASLSLEAVPSPVRDGDATAQLRPSR
jgi:eukaryotic-like serine/threonine-protein kinase